MLTKNHPKDIDKTHPYKTKEIINKIIETIELTLANTKTNKNVCIFICEHSSRLGFPSIM